MKVSQRFRDFVSCSFSKFLSKLTNRNSKLEIRNSKFKIQNSKGFTLIELLIVIGIIAILASAVIVTINPGRQFASARDATRERHLQSLNQSILSYQIDNMGNLDGLGLLPISTEICNTNVVEPEECDDLINLTILIPDYISSLPVDPLIGADSETTGYLISYQNNQLAIGAKRAETRDVGEFGFSFFNKGEEFVSITGGWIEGWTNGTGSRSKVTGPPAHLFVSAEFDGSISEWGWVTDDTIDLTDIETLFVDWKGARTAGTGVVYSRLIISPTKSSHGSNFTARLQNSGNFSQQVDTLDVSGETGNHYIRLYANAATTLGTIMEVEVYRVWGER